MTWETPCQILVAAEACHCRDSQEKHIWNQCKLPFCGRYEVFINNPVPQVNISNNKEYKALQNMLGSPQATTVCLVTF